MDDYTHNTSWKVTNNIALITPITNVSGVLAISIQISAKYVPYGFVFQYKWSLLVT